MPPPTPPNCQGFRDSCGHKKPLGADFCTFFPRDFDSGTQLSGGKQEPVLKNQLCNLHQGTPGPRFELEGLNHRAVGDKSRVSDTDECTPCLVGAWAGTRGAGVGLPHS